VVAPDVLANHINPGSLEIHDSMASLLLVDDDFDMVDTCAEVLRSEGHHVRVARNGEEGLAQVEDDLPDLVLCDVDMPVLDGPNMAFRMFSHDVGQEEIPILLVSGAPDLRGIAEKVGTPYFLAKPFSVEQLLARVGRVLEERLPPRPRP
jgi:CheY-like chemotaxis protein